MQYAKQITPEGPISEIYQREIKYIEQMQCLLDKALGQYFRDDSQRQGLKSRLITCEYPEEFKKILYGTNYFQKRQNQIQKIAHLIFQIKDRAKNANKLSGFYDALRNRKVDELQITKIKGLVEKGKKKAVRRQLIEQLGNRKGNQLFLQFEKEIPQNIPKPPPGCIFLKKKDGLEIYNIKKQVSESLSQVFFKYLLSLQSIILNFQKYINDCFC